MKRPRILRFGIYEVDLNSGELRKAGAKIRLQHQPFKVLEALLDSPGEVVTREELHTRIWPEESFGDFDQAVNIAVTKLRAAFGDSAKSPRFIETLPRRGYRFVAPVQQERVEPGSSLPALITGNVIAGNVIAGNGAARDAPADVHADVLTGPRGLPARRLLSLLAIVALLAILIAAAVHWIRPSEEALDFHRISYGRGTIRSARFTSGGHSVVYGAAWDGRPPQLFWAQPETPEARSYALPDADILSISPSGEMAILLNRRAGVGYISHGTLALMPVTGATPREMLDDVQDADWNPQGNSLAIVHWLGDRCNLEYPAGKTLYETTGGHWISDIRISPQGNLIAFADHPLQGDDAGTVQIVDLAGKTRTLTRQWASLRGLAWDHSGDSIWLSASDIEGERQRPRAIYQVTLAAKLQEMFHESGDLTIHDISGDRRLLLTRDATRYEMMGQFSGESRNLSWLDFSRGDDLSEDGSQVLFTVEGEAAGKNYEVYLRKTDGAPPVRLGAGYGSAIAPGGARVLAVAPFGTAPNLAAQFILLPVGQGAAKVFSHDAISHLTGAWFPDGQRIVFTGSEPGRSVRAWVQDLAGGTPRPITPEGVSGTRLSPDGKLLCAVDAEGRFWIYPVAGGKPAAVPGIEPGDFPVRWMQDGKSLLVARADHFPVRVYRIKLESGRRELVQQLVPHDPAGVMPDVSTVSPSVLATPDGNSYLYSYVRLTSDLYVAAPK